MNEATKLVILSPIAFGAGLLVGAALYLTLRPKKEVAIKVTNPQPAPKKRLVGEQKADLQILLTASQEAAKRKDKSRAADLAELAFFLQKEPRMFYESRAADGATLAERAEAVLEARS